MSVLQPFGMFGAGEIVLCIEEGIKNTSYLVELYSTGTSDAFDKVGFSIASVILQMLCKSGAEEQTNENQKPIE